MARKSRWQQFTDSFNAVYGTFTDAAKKIEVAKVNRQEFKDDAGNPLEGLALDRARTKALGDIYTKYGDPEGAIRMRSSAEGLGAMSRENDVGEATKADQIYQKGAGATGLLNANISNTNMNTANTGSIMNRRETLLPGEVVGQGLSNEGQAKANIGQDLINKYNSETMGWRVGAAENQYRSGRAQADVDEGTVGSRIRSSEAGADINEANAETAEANASVASQLADLQVRLQEANVGLTESQRTVAEETAQARIDQILAESRAAIEESGNTAVTAGQQRDANFIASEIISEMANMDFGTDADADAYFISEFGKATRGNPYALGVMDTVNKQGIIRLGTEAALLTTKMKDAAMNGGLDAMADEYENVLDGVDAYIVRDGGSVVVMGRRADGAEFVIDQDTGEGAEKRIEQRLMAQVSDPFKAMEIAAAQLENQQTEARTELLETQTLETEARTGLLTAQTEETWKEIETSGGSISKDREIALRGLASLMSSDGYLLLQEDDPEAARAMQFEFMKTFGLVQPTQTQQPPSNKPSADPVPLDSNGKPIVDQSTWDRMPEEDKDLFR
jgi:hypothetical protein